jgi:four helix bundle protein
LTAERIQRVGDYRGLKVWRRGHELALEVYRHTREFPAAEVYGLTAQLRGAASSIPANLAEGSGRNSPNELRRYALISLGSASELEYHLLLARDLGYLDDRSHATLAEAADHVKRMLARLIATIPDRRRTRARLSAIRRSPERITDDG